MLRLAVLAVQAAALASGAMAASARDEAAGSRMPTEAAPSSAAQQPIDAAGSTALSGTGSASAPTQPVAPVPPWSDAARQRLLGGPDRSDPALRARRLAERTQLVGDGEAALARADAESALRAFEAASNIEHAADIEIGLVRSLMQHGDYRRAIAFASHTAGAHRRDTGGAALYAWLLHIGGQGVFARRLLDDAERSMPGDPRLAEVRARLASPAPMPSDTLLVPPARLAPYASAPRLPPTARLTANGVLVDGGRSALVPISALGRADAAANAVWVRNGLGHTVRAQLQQRDEARGLALLRLGNALPLGDEPPAGAARDAFAGSVATLVEYALPASETLPTAAEIATASTNAAPASWPLLRQGFLGTAGSGTGGLARLGIALPPGARGGPVFDAAGRLAGIALPPLDEAEGRPPGDGIDSGSNAGRRGDRLMPISQLRAGFGEAIAPPPPVSAEAQPRGTAPAALGPGAGVPLEAVYERALRVALQVIVDTAPAP